MKIDHFEYVWAGRPLKLSVCGQVAREIDQCECVGRSPLKSFKIMRLFLFCFLYKAYYVKHRGVLLRKHCKEGASVVTQF